MHTLQLAPKHGVGLATLKRLADDTPTRVMS